MKNLIMNVKDITIKLIKFVKNVVHLSSRKSVIDGLKEFCRTFIGYGIVYGIIGWILLLIIEVGKDE